MKKIEIKIPFILKRQNKLQKISLILINFDSSINLIIRSSWIIDSKTSIHPPIPSTQLLHFHIKTGKSVVATPWTGKFGLNRGGKKCGGNNKRKFRNKSREPEAGRAPRNWEDKINFCSIEYGTVFEKRRGERNFSGWLKRVRNSPLNENNQGYRCAGPVSCRRWPNARKFLSIRRAK